jgi:hypothetical protein
MNFSKEKAKGNLKIFLAELENTHQNLGVAFK